MTKIFLKWNYLSPSFIVYLSNKTESEREVVRKLSLHIE